MHSSKDAMDRGTASPPTAAASSLISSISPWIETAELPQFSPLGADANADVCVVGAGIAGLSVAYELSLAGLSVVVLEMAPRIGDGMTGRTTAHLTYAFDDRYFEVERLHGEEAARLVAESHSAAIDRVAAIVASEDMDCSLERVDGWLFAALDSPDDVLERELECAQRAGLHRVSLEQRTPLDFDTGPALRFPDQAQFHPLRYLAGLARAIVGRGGRIFTETQATEIVGGANARVETAHGHTVRATAIVVATNSPCNHRVVMNTKQAAYQTYAIAAEIPHRSVARGLYWDTADPYHYVRLHTEGTGAAARELLIVGGEDHKTGQSEHPETAWTRLESWMRRAFPSAGAVRMRWSGEVLEPVDALAFIGKSPLDAEGVYLVTGDSGNGMTHGVIAGMLIASLVQDREHPWEEMYRPNRKSIRALGEFAKENLNVVKEYGDWLKRGDVADVSEIAHGEGAVVRCGLKLHAVHRDGNGKLHEFSAACPHLGCVVQWNGAEKSWDCPCHGSRFGADGRLIQGPATKGLHRLAAEVPAARESV
jgi:glycine/D-amino acid oxidase-like deaminating enzyme/nitrite reductase/ring-hydroxylating ferredoxin subunit